MVSDVYGDENVSIAAHGVVARSDGRMEWAKLDHETKDAVAEMQHAARFMEHIPLLSSFYEATTPADLEAMSDLVAQDLPLPLMMHLIRKGKNAVRLEVPSRVEAAKIREAMRLACRTVVGDLPTYTAFCAPLRLDPSLGREFMALGEHEVLIHYNFMWLKQTNKVVAKWKWNAMASFLEPMVLPEGDATMWLPSAPGADEFVRVHTLVYN